MTASDDKRTSGLATAVADLLSAPAAAADNQAELFDPEDFEPDMPLPVSAAPRSGPKGGRPKGARNKSTEALRSYILSRYRHPLIGLAEMWSRTPEQLATELGLYEYKYFEGDEIAKLLAVGEAAKLQQNAMIAALPYLAQKQPLAIEHKNVQRGVMVLGDFKMQVNGNIGGLPLPSDDARPAKQLEASPLGGDPA